MDWAVQDAGKASKVKAAIIYQQDDFGKDGLEGWRMAAKKHGVKIVVERAIKPGQKSMVSEIKLLKKKRATHVFLAVLPSATGPILGTAAKMKLSILDSLWSLLAESSERTPIERARHATIRPPRHPVTLLKVA